MDPKGIKLLRYRYGKDIPVVDMQDRLQAASVTKDISGKEDIQLAMLGSFEEPQTAFTPGDFVALKDQTDTTWSWGRVSVVRSTMKREASGILTHAPYAVMVQGWYDFLSRSKVHVMQVSNRPSVGTLFLRNDWLQLAADLANMKGNPAGLILQFMLRKLLRIKLPPSLGGGWVADEIPVVYDRDTARRYAPEFEDIEPVDFGDLMPQLATAMLGQRSSDVGSLIANMFLFETSIVELIPYLSMRPGNVLVPTTDPNSQPQDGAQQPAPSDTRVVGQRTKLGEILNAQPVLVYRIKPFRTEPLYRAAVSKIKYRAEDAEAGYLDRELSLYDEPTRRSLINARAQARAETNNLLFDQGLFRQVTFEPSAITPLPYSHIMSMSRQRSDADRVNATTINAVPAAQPTGTSITDLDYVGLPVSIDDQIENHGLRLRIARWSMYPPDNMTSPDITLYYRSVAAQVMQFYEKSHLYETGSMQLHFAHALHFVESDTRQQSTYDRSVLDLEPGRWFRTSFQGMDDVRATPPEPPSPPSAAQVEYGPPPGTASDEYYGYITSVAHNIQRLPSGMLSANTQVNFMRGHFADMWDVVNGVNVPMDEVDRPPNGQGQGGQRAGGGRGCSLRPAEIAGVLNPTVCSTFAFFRSAANSFSQGESLTDWGPNTPPIMRNPLLTYKDGNLDAPAISPDLYNNITQHYVPDTARSTANLSFPSWLYCWFLESISVMPQNEYLELKEFVRKPQTPNTSLQTQQANLQAIIACAYVIESYWRSRPAYQDVRLRIRSIPRAREGGYHKFHAAMDFYLEYPANFSGEQAGALQVWASLFRLAEARRIPYGGRGLYLNVNPTTGIKGTTPAEAGSPSKANCQYPPGGSSWTHYDIRAMWGITTRQKLDANGRPTGALLPSFFTQWAGTDWNGDGKDEIEISNRFRPPNDRTQNGGVIDTATYVWANVADPQFTYLEEYVSGTKAQAAPGVAAIMQARKDRPDRVQEEEARVPVRDALRNYFNSYGLNDKWLHAVTNRVPNMFQVFELERYVGRLEPIQETARPTKSTNAGDLYLAKFENGTIQTAPLVVIFGGTDVAGEPANVYMKRYAFALFRGNHVVIAKNDKVSYDDVAILAAEATPHTAGKPRTLYVFSNGVVPVITWVRRYAGALPIPDYSAIYMVDAYLGSNTTRARDITRDFITDMTLRAPHYKFIYTDATTENGMTAETRNRIIGGGNTPNGIVGLAKEAVPKGNAATQLEWHMKANEVAMSSLIQSPLTE